MIIVVCNSDFGKQSTIGFRAYHTSKEYDRLGKLDKVVVRGNHQDSIKVSKLFPFYRLFNLGLSFLNQKVFAKFNARKWQILIFDYICSMKLNKDSRVLHSFEYAPKTMKKAQKLGMRVVLDAQLPFHEDHRKAAEQADIILCPSQFVLDSYKEFETRTKLVPFGVNTETFTPGKNKQTPPLHFVNIGSVEKRKGILELCEAWTKYKYNHTDKLFICGRIHTSLSHLPKKYPNIKFLGFVTPQEELRTKDVFVFPSHCEGSAKATYEALACGLPVICTFESGSVIRDGTDGFIIPKQDVNSIITKMEYCHENLGMVKSMSVNARERSKEFTWEIYGKKVLEVIDNGI